MRTLLAKQIFNFGTVIFICWIALFMAVAWMWRDLVGALLVALFVASVVWDRAASFIRVRHAINTESEAADDHVSGAVEGAYRG